MKTKFISIIALFFITGIVNKAEARLSPRESVFQLQFQKSLFVSGEKIWFKNSMASGHDNNHQTIMYIDLCSEGSIINSCILKRENNHWEGDILIPDSLETGIYLFRAYTGNYDGRAEMVSKLITVINRFGNNNTNETRKLNREYQPIDLVHEIPGNSGSALKVYGNSASFATKSSIDLRIEKDKSLITSGISFSVFRIPENNIVSDIEAHPEHKVVDSAVDQTKIFNKLTMCGKVIDKKSKEPVGGEMVLFSIPDSIPQINYAVTDEKGEFIFDVGEYYGTQDVIVQTQSKEKDVEIILYPNLLIPPAKIPFYISAELENSEFVSLTVKQSIMNKAYEQAEEKLSVPSSLKYPFYGSVTNVVIPDRYIDLDDFEEITKELLPLCRIKKEKKEVVLNIYDPENMRATENPWIIVDGIPVSNLKLLLPFNSQKIRKIETQTEIRCYGGLYIDGALSVFTYDGNYPIALPSNALRMSFNTFHVGKDYPNQRGLIGNSYPDFRDVLYWDPILELLNNAGNLKIQSSFEKGVYAAIVQAMDENGTIHRSVFTFTVK